MVPCYAKLFQVVMTGMEISGINLLRILTEVILMEHGPRLLLCMIHAFSFHHKYSETVVYMLQEENMEPVMGKARFIIRCQISGQVARALDIILLTPNQSCCQTVMYCRHVNGIILLLIMIRFQTLILIRKTPLVVLMNPHG